MSNLNTILNKLGKIEAIEKTNLEKHEIELNISTDSKELVSKYFGLTDTINSKYVGLSNDMRAILGKIDEAVKLSNEMPKVITKYEQLAKELGIDVNNVQELKDMKLAIKNVNEYKTLSSKLKDIITING
jgi:hypothetical protein